MTDRIKEIEERCKVAPELALVVADEIAPYLQLRAKGRGLVCRGYCDGAGESRKLFHLFAHAREDITFLLHELEVRERALVLCHADRRFQPSAQQFEYTKWIDQARKDIDRTGMGNNKEADAVSSRCKSKDEKTNI